MIDLKDKERFVGAVALVMAGVLGRIYLRGFLPHAPTIYVSMNGITQPLFMIDLFFVVAVASLISGLLLRGYYTFAVPFMIMLITDIYYGNTYIFLFTWSGFVMIALLGFFISKKKTLSLRHTPHIIGTGVAGVLLYDLWTNFGCWLGWYPHSLSGFILCYTVAIPFTLWHLLSTTVAISAIIVPVLYLKEKEILKINYRIRTTESRVTVVLSIALILLSPLQLLI